LAAVFIALLGKAFKGMAANYQKEERAFHIHDLSNPLIFVL
jgi:hypothetical protein